MQSALAFSKIFQISYFFLREKSPFAPLHIFFCEPGEYNTVKAFHLVAKVFKYSSHNAVAAAVNFNSNLFMIPGIGVCQEVYGCRSIIESNTFKYLLKIFLIQWAVQANVVNFFYLVTRVC